MKANAWRLPESTGNWIRLSGHTPARSSASSVSAALGGYITPTDSLSGEYVEGSVIKALMTDRKHWADKGDPVSAFSGARLLW